MSAPSSDSPPPASQRDQSIGTPPGRPRGLAGLLTLRTLPHLAAQIGIRLASWRGRPFRLGSTVIAVRHADVMEALTRDLDFCLRPVHAPKFDQIGFHFILGMDRSPEFVEQRRVLYTALACVDVDTLRANAARDIEQTLDRTGTGAIDVVEGYARPIAAATASRLFGIAPANNVAFMDAARAIFGNSFLNPTGDEAMADRALVAANLLSDWFEAEIARRRAAGAFGRDMMGALLAAGVGDDLTRRTLGGMLVGAIDTTASSVAKIVSVLISDSGLAARVRTDCDDLTAMWGWCNEALRRWPHGPILARQAARATVLAGTEVDAGDTVILWTQAAMLDPGAFPDPQDLRPDRVDAPYLHLGGGLHPCAGRGVNAWQIPMLVAGLMKREPTRLGTMRWAGPFPAHLPLHLGKRP